MFSGSHGLVLRQAFGFNGEIRFVTQVVNSTTVQVNAAFSSAPASGNALTAAVTYFPADELPSVSVFDYWDPVKRGGQDRGWAPLATGCRCESMGTITRWSSAASAQDVIDTVSFAAGQGGLSSFPSEPAIDAEVSRSRCRGISGQAWLGSPSSRFQTVTSAAVEVVNDLDLRTREFGSALP